MLRNGIFIMTNTLRENLIKVDNTINLALDKSPYDLSGVLSYLKDAKGKNIRAMTALAVAEAIGDVTDEIIDGASSIELMHLATLVHDDVIDDAPKRRGIDSVQKRFGKKYAVITGDYLFSKCFILMSKYSAENLEYFAKAISYVCVGEATQLNYNYDYDISFSTYKRIIGGKTAALFAFSTYCPTRALSFDNKKSETLLRAGYYMGLVFQMIDDALDYSFDINYTKKEILKDLKDGVITYPLIYAFSKEPQLKQMLIDDSENNVDYVIKRAIELGSVEETKLLAKKYYDISKKKFISALGVEKSKGLIDILDKAYYRNS